MKILSKFVLPLVLAFYLAGTAGAYYNPGKPTGYITDFTNTLNLATVNGLNQDLAAFEKATNHQIFIAIIPSMKGDYIEYFAVKLFEDWKPGNKGLDNGVLFLISMEEKQMRIEVGYGLEGALTDSKASQIINDIAKPYFRDGNFNAGVMESISAIKQIIKGEVVDFSKSGGGKESKNIMNYIGVLYIWGFWIIAILGRFFINFFAKSKEWWAGGVIGGVIGTILGLILFSAIGYFVIAIFISLTGGGFLLDYLASTGKIKPGKGGGGFWFFGGGGGGGGFGGGGGGFSGGGGASGRW